MKAGLPKLETKIFISIFYLVNLFKTPYLFYYKRKHENMFQYRDRKYQEEKKYKKYSKNMTLIKAAWLLYFILSLG